MAKYAEMESYTMVRSRELLEKAAERNKSIKEVPEKQDRKDKV